MQHGLGRKISTIVNMPRDSLNSAAERQTNADDGMLSNSFKKQYHHNIRLGIFKFTLGTSVACRKQGLKVILL